MSKYGYILANVDITNVLLFREALEQSLTSPPGYCLSLSRDFSKLSLHWLKAHQFKYLFNCLFTYLPLRFFFFFYIGFAMMTEQVSTHVLSLSVVLSFCHSFFSVCLSPLLLSTHDRVNSSLTDSFIFCDLIASHSCFSPK